MLANRLSADGRFRVLVLEAGGEETHDPLINVPFAFGAVMCDPKLLWEDWTTEQVCNEGYDNKVWPMLRVHQLNMLKIKGIENQIISE